MQLPKMWNSIPYNQINLTKITEHNSFKLEITRFLLSFSYRHIEISPPQTRTTMWQFDKDTACFWGGQLDGVSVYCRIKTKLVKGSEQTFYRFIDSMQEKSVSTCLFLNVNPMNFLILQRVSMIKSSYRNGLMKEFKGRITTDEMG